MNGFRTLFVRMNLRHFREKRLRSLLTISGVSAGVMLVFSIGLINATLLESVRSSVRALAGAAEIEVATADRNGIPTSSVARIQEVDGVEKAVPVLRSTTVVTGRGGDARPMIIGITPDFSSLFPRSSGEFGSVSITGGFGGTGGGLLLADSVAQDVGAGIGDRVEVETPSGPQRVQVTGRISGSAVQFLNGGQMGIMLLAGAQETFERPDRIDSVYVIADRDEEIAAVEQRIEAALEVPVIVGPPGERGAGFEQQVGSVSTLTSLAGTVALLVSIFVVFNTMSMSLAERRREISMAMALGASARQMFAAFMIEASVLGAAASAGGIAAGYLLARALIEPVLDGFPVLPISGTNPVEVPLMQLAIAVFGGLAVSIAGAYVPARRVLKVAPVESLRPTASYEWEGARRHPSLRRTLTIAFGPIVLSIASAFSYIVAFNDQRWLVNVSLTFGLIGISALLLRAVPFGIDVLRRPFVRLFGTEGRLASDALQKNRGRTTFTVAALILTLGMVVGVASSLGSYESELERSAGQWLGAELYVTASSYQALGADQPLSPSTQDAFRGIEGIDGIYPVRYGFLETGGDQMMVYAVPAARAAKEGFGVISAVAGVPQQELIDRVSEGQIFIARYTAEEQNWAEGDTVQLPTPQGPRDFEVGGIFNDLNSFQAILMEQSTWAEVWKDDKVDRLGIVLDPGAPVAQVRSELEAVVKQRDIPAKVLTREQSVGQLVDTVKGLFQMARGIQFAALVVALLTIANTMFTAVLERRWEMGLQRAIGMGRSQIGRSLLLEAVGIGLVGGAGALIMGTATGFMMTQLMEAQYAWLIPYQAPLGLIALALGAGIVIAVIAGVLPSRMAVRAPIIESLRYE
ncbi:MAG TPA: FtsX-like permease family protein [Actinomycetota bacterium]|nr:FtsX-like permease family protein [Actinomycetota bacterium]